MTTPRNKIATSKGTERAVCQYCGKQSRPMPRASLAYISTGWATSPFPDHFMHADGSTGSTFRCPTCHKRRDFPIAPKLDR